MGGKSGSQRVEETPEQRAVAQIASEQYEDYITRFVPVENQAIAQALDTEGRLQQLRGITNADFFQRFGEQQPQVMSNLAQRGLRADSGAFRSGLGGYLTDRSYALGQGLAGAELASQQDLATNAQRIVNLGQGQANQAAQGIVSAADAAQRQAIMDARSAAAARGALQQIVGTGIGLGLGAYGNAGRASPMGTGLTPGVTPITNPNIPVSFAPGSF